MGSDPEDALAKSCDKFIGRFERVEKLAKERGVDMKASSIEILDGLWKDAKNNKDVLSQAKLSEDIN